VIDRHLPCKRTLKWKFGKFAHVMNNLETQQMKSIDLIATECEKERWRKSFVSVCGDEFLDPKDVSETAKKRLRKSFESVWGN
jgi:hypothetical protein